MPPTFVRPLSNTTRRIAVAARRRFSPSLVDACLRSRPPGGLLQQLVHAGALHPDDADRLAHKADATQRVHRLPKRAPLPDINRLAGQELAGVHLLHPLGSGGTGTVYAGRDKDQGLLAVKILNPRMARGKKTVRRFFREARALKMIDDPHIVRVIGAGRDRGLCYLLLEFVSRNTLRELVDRQGPLSPRVALRLICQVAIGLAAAHDWGVLHRDVKPNNILVLDETRAKLADFGNAQIDERTGKVVIGSVRYMSPEHCRDEELDPRSDIYALGATLHFALSGQPPFTGRTPAAVVQQHLHKAPKPLRKLRRSIPAALEAVVLRCLQKRRKNRYPTAESLRRTLTRILARLD